MLLRWHLEVGPQTEGWLADLAEDEPDAAHLRSVGKPPDDAFVPPGAEIGWAAFWALHADRPYIVTGHAAPMGAMVIEPRPRRIPFWAMDAYARRYEIEGGEFELMAALLGKLDDEFMRQEAERVRDRAG